MELRRQFFAVRQIVAVPANQGVVAGVFKEKFQRRRFDVAVAKDHVGFALMTGITSLGASHFILHPIRSPEQIPTILNTGFASLKPIANSYHFAWTNNL